MSELVREGVERLMAAPPENIIDLVDACVESESSPASTLGAYVTELDIQAASQSDEVARAASERIVGLVPLMREIESELFESFPEASMRPFHLDYERTRRTVDDMFEIPLADANRWVTYTNTHEVREVLDGQLYAQRGGDPEHVLYGSLGVPGSRIATIPAVTRMPDIDYFTTLAREQFLQDERYVTPAEAVSHIARTVDSKLLVPMIVALESDVPKRAHPDSEYFIPIISTREAYEERFMLGVLWAIFSVAQVREIIADTCRTDQTHFAKGFDEAEFEEWVLQYDPAQNPDTLIDEINRRTQLHYSPTAKPVHS